MRGSGVPCVCASVETSQPPRRGGRAATRRAAGYTCESCGTGRCWWPGVATVRQEAQPMPPSVDPPRRRRGRNGRWLRARPSRRPRADAASCCTAPSGKESHYGRRPPAAARRVWRPSAAQRGPRGYEGSLDDARARQPVMRTSCPAALAQPRSGGPGGGRAERDDRSGGAARAPAPAIASRPARSRAAPTRRAGGSMSRRMTRGRRSLARRRASPRSHRGRAGRSRRGKTRAARQRRAKS
jgi:hypothetical protein